MPASHATELEPRIRRELQSGLAEVIQEFDGRVDSSEIERIGNEVAQALLDDARFADFVPILTVRYTRERVRQATSTPS